MSIDKYIRDILGDTLKHSIYDCVVGDYLWEIGDIETSPLIITYTDNGITKYIGFSITKFNHRRCVWNMWKCVSIEEDIDRIAINDRE